jgi:hypothetical protein
MPLYGKSILERTLEETYNSGAKKIVVIAPRNKGYDIEMDLIANKLRKKHAKELPYYGKRYNIARLMLDIPTPEENKKLGLIDVRSFSYPEAPPMHYALGRTISNLKRFRTKYTVCLYGDAVYPKHAIEYTLDKAIEKLETEKDGALVHLMESAVPDPKKKAFVVDEQGLFKGYTSENEATYEPAIIVFRNDVLLKMLNKIKTPHLGKNNDKNMEEWLKLNYDFQLRDLISLIAEHKGEVHVIRSKTKYHNVNSIEGYKILREFFGEKKKFKEIFSDIMGL